MALSKPVLLGDSIMKRLYKRYANSFDDLSEVLCESGQGIEDLISLVKTNRANLKGKRVIVMIATNNILRNDTRNRICESLRLLSRRLRRLNCEVVWCEILPIPRLEWQATTLSKIREVNAYIRSFEPSGIKIVFYTELLVAKGKP